VDAIDPFAAILGGDFGGAVWSPAAGGVDFGRVFTLGPGVEYRLEKPPAGEHFGAGGKERLIAAHGVDEHALVGVRLVAVEDAGVIEGHFDRLEFVAEAGFFGE